ncbi:MAG: hypothetical protein K6U14_11995 [Firmicutes bacterium]|nr:hypothetical protein [Alicyclobacillaceae bacterium]MCL6498334.1 hypothetical protein [Bacillota bacterium]
MKQRAHWVMAAWFGFIVAAMWLFVTPAALAAGQTVVVVNSLEDYTAAKGAGYSNILYWSQVSSNPSQLAGDNVIIAGGTATIPASAGAAIAQAGATSVVQVGGATVQQTSDMLDKYASGTSLQNVAALADQGADVSQYSPTSNPYLGTGVTWYNQTNHGVDGVSQYLPPPTSPAAPAQPDAAAGGAGAAGAAARELERHGPAVDQRGPDHHGGGPPGGPGLRRHLRRWGVLGHGMLVH